MTKYITGLHALNIPCELNTSGDWHRGSLDWDNPTIKDSETSIFKDWGIYEREGKFIADHIRAILDIMEEGEKLEMIATFHSDFISTNEYDDILKAKINMLQNLPHWKHIEILRDRNLTGRKLSIEELRKNGKLRKRRNTFNSN